MQYLQETVLIEWFRLEEILKVIYHLLKLSLWVSWDHSKLCSAGEEAGSSLKPQSLPGKVQLGREMEDFFV